MKQLLLRRTAVSSDRSVARAARGRQLTASLLWGRHGHCHQTCGLQIWFPRCLQKAPSSKAIATTHLIVVMTSRQLPRAFPRFASTLPHYLARPIYAPSLIRMGKEHLRLLDTDRLLDLGCGPGWLACVCSLCREVVAVDLEPSILEAARAAARSASPERGQCERRPNMVRLAAASWRSPSGRRVASLLPRGYQPDACDGTGGLDQQAHCSYIPIQRVS
jgi:methyltransferase family protein